MFCTFTNAELNMIANLKRVNDLFHGIKEFRDTVLHNPKSAISLVADFGLTIDKKELIAIFEKTKERTDKKSIQTSTKYSDIEKLFLRYKQFSNNNSWYKNVIEKESTNTQFNIWRKRQIKRSCSETGTPKEMSYFPIFAFELAIGCSVNCPFCCFDAQKLENVFMYNENNVKLWKSILNINIELFDDMSKLSTCYHATEPFDNPDYLLFMEDFFQINGILPQTTSAAPFKNLDMTRQMLEMRKQDPTTVDRFSILATSQYKKLFKEFTPLELMHIELVHHNDEGLANKAYSGRGLKQTEKIKKSNQIVHDFYKVDKTLEQKSVECICGFLVNMVKKSILLIAPCIANEENPKGYKTIAKGKFENAQEYKAWILKTIEEFMPISLDWNTPIAFRKDLEYQNTKEGFELTACNNKYTIKGKSWHQELGKMISKTNKTAGNISIELGVKGAL